MGRAVPVGLERVDGTRVPEVDAAVGPLVVAGEGMEVAVGVGLGVDVAVGDGEGTGVALGDGEGTGVALAVGVGQGVGASAAITGSFCGEYHIRVSDIPTTKTAKDASATTGTRRRHLRSDVRRRTVPPLGSGDSDSFTRDSAQRRAARARVLSGSSFSTRLA
ncbi:MAG: hypothetical protein PVF54_02560 [Anaerolineae bacterium]